MRGVLGSVVIIICSFLRKINIFSEEFKQAITILIQDIFPIGSRPTSRVAEDTGFLKGILRKR